MNRTDVSDRGPSKGGWREAVAHADATGDASTLVGLLLDQSIAVDRQALAELLRHKTLRNHAKRPRSIPVAERNELVIRTYQEARADGICPEEAYAAAGEAGGIGADAARNVVRRHR